MDKTYQSDVIERKYRQLWLDNNLFDSSHNAQSEQAYCIMLPPPNVTGTLHMGHAFQHSVMDVLIRYQRMQGKQTLWQAGTDHAGIATQMVVERQLNEKGQTRHDLGRDAFVEKVWQWKQQSGSHITEQMKRLGASVDWQRECFTMDENLTKSVQKVFVDLYQEGLIYRGKRLVNWDPVLETAVSDLEVINTEEDGELFYVRYPFVDGSGFIVVATTRPETILADGAIAISPSDKRYLPLVGKTVHVPMTTRQIPIIVDDYVDSEFGTGCVKITPAHDFNDWQVGQRHEMEVINLLTPDAKMNQNAPKVYQGLDRFEARARIIEDLKKQDLLEKVVAHKLKKPRGDRTGAVIEPYLTDQWFVKMTDLAAPAMDVVKTGEVRFVPNHWQNTYFNWLKNIEDWCISRQIWWGHRIPAWYDEKGNFFVANSLAEAQVQAGEGAVLTQDNDVLDTWFSSALWPFSTLGWPENTQELARFFPTNVLVTGFDIIFFWVARMIMFSLKFTKQVPFKDVYITGLVRDASGQKMSKSKGNVLDPMDIIDGITLPDLIAKRTKGLMQPKMVEGISKQTKKDYGDGIDAYGVDALRFTFAALASFGRDIKFDLKRIEGYRNFCNKLWNASRFILLTLDEKPKPSQQPLSITDQWILSKLQHCKMQVNQHLSDYRLDLMAQQLYEFVWHDYCDWYLEFYKHNDNNTEKNSPYVLTKVLLEVLKLLHPIIPFITEEIWQQCFHLYQDKASFLTHESYPTVDEKCINEVALTQVAWLQQFVLAVRQIRGEMNIAPKKMLVCYLHNACAADEEKLRQHQFLLKSLAKLSEITQLKEIDSNTPYATAVVDKMTLLVPLTAVVDIKEEVIRLTKMIEKLKRFEAQVTAKLGNDKFMQGAPSDIIKAEKNKRIDTQQTLAKLQQQLDKIQ